MTEYNPFSLQRVVIKRSTSIWCSTIACHRVVVDCQSGSTSVTDSSKDSFRLRDCPIHLAEHRSM